MDAKENSDKAGSPEERLLRIIKGQSRPAQTNQNKIPESSLSQAQGKVQLNTPSAAIREKENLSQKISQKEKSFLGHLKPSHKAKEPKAVFRKDTLSKLVVLQRFNGGLFIFWCLLVIIFFVFARIAVLRESSRRYAKGPFIRQEVSLDKEKFQPRPFSYYADIISRRNLFKILLQQEREEEGRPVRIAPSELLKSYALAGVINDENPQAIIEDKISRKTYFLNRGQYLGDFKIDDIVEGKVILELKGQRFELSL